MNDINYVKITTPITNSWPLVQYECNLCKALVIDREGHNAWHDQLLELIMKAATYGMNC